MNFRPTKIWSLVIGHGWDRGTPGQPLMRDDGGAGIFDESGAGAPDRTFRTKGIFCRLWYIQTNMIASSVPINSRLAVPRPRNTFTVQVSIGKQIAVLEQATHRECRRRRTRPRRYNQSAVPMLTVPKMPTNTCAVKSSNIKTSLEAAIPAYATVVMNRPALDLGPGCGSVRCAILLIDWESLSLALLHYS